MRTWIVTIVLGILFVGTIEALPTSFTQTHLSQHLFGGGWFRSKESDSYQVCVRKVTPGVGFEFTAKYATASIKYGNGTVIDITKINGNLKYENTMSSLWQGDPSIGPPFDNPIHKLKYEFRKALRKSRKLLGLPATEDIGVLAGILTELKHSTESIVGHPIEGALAAIPNLPYLQDGDLEEAFDYAGITKLASPRYESQTLNWVNAAYSGMGYGLCKDWTDEVGCQEEMIHMVPSQTLAISFDRDALRITNVLMQNAYQSSPGQLFTDYTLAYNHTFKDDFWIRVIDYIVEKGKSAETNIQGLVVTGEFAEEKLFLNSLWSALYDLEDAGKLGGRAADIYAKLQVTEFNALYLGARGAAELAMRWQGEVEECVEVEPPSEVETDDSEGAKPGIWIGQLEDKLQEVGTTSVSVQSVTMKMVVATGQSKADGGAVEILPDDKMGFWGLDSDMMRDAARQAQEGAGDRAWELIATLSGDDPHVTVVIFDPNSGEPKLSRLGKL